ncbi:MAG: LPS assembly protein LptD, partial [Syntrophales bacterium]|nr:LPS assembly protein LptD [Syntrophales bacterium]
DVYKRQYYGKAGLPVYVLTPIPATGEADLPTTGPGAPVHIEADTLAYNYDTDTYRAFGRVRIAYGDAVLTADTVVFDRRTNEAEAAGDVHYASGGDIIAGEWAVADVAQRTGVIHQGRLFVAKTHLYIRGERIERQRGDAYFVVKPELTTCDGESPDWRLQGEQLRVRLEGYGLLKGGTFYVKDVPILYSPYLPFPAKTKRQSGFLFPRLGYSRDRLGMDVTLPYFWAVGESYDATLYPRYLSARGFQQGVEFRYAPSKETFGTLYGDFLNDGKSLKETVGNLRRDWDGPTKRWALYGSHEQHFSRSFYVRADIARVSEPFYFKDFSSGNYFLDHYSPGREQPFKRVTFVGNESLNALDSTMRIVKGGERFHLTALVKSTDDFTVASNDGTLQKYPEITLAAVKMPLFGTLLHGEGTATYDYFYRGEGQRGHYWDINPLLSLPFGFGDYLQITPAAGVRGTIWSRDDDINDGLKKGGNREVYTGGVTVASEVPRVFVIGGKEIAKIRHSIRPEVTYRYTRVAHQDHAMPNYVTAVDDANTLSYALINTLTARVKDNGSGGKYVEFLRIKLAQSYDIREAGRDETPGREKRPFSDVEVEVDLRPVSYLSAAVRNRYAVYDGTWTQANYEASLASPRGDRASLTYRYTRDRLEETNLSLKAMVTRELSLSFVAKWDHLNHRDIEKLYSFLYQRQCWSLGFEYGDRDTDKTYGLKLSLYGL